MVGLDATIVGYPIGKKVMNLFLKVPSLKLPSPPSDAGYEPGQNDTLFDESLDKLLDEYRLPARADVDTLYFITTTLLLARCVVETILLTGALLLTFNPKLRNNASAMGA